jgi:hypothetical protein
VLPDHRRVEGDEEEIKVSKMMKQLLGACAVGALVFVAACDNRGSAEKGGENLDSAAEQMTEGHANPGDGPMEQAGEQIDQTTGHQNSDPIDAAHDATDNNPATQP